MKDLAVGMAHVGHSSSTKKNTGSRLINDPHLRESPAQMRVLAQLGTLIAVLFGTRAESSCRGYDYCLCDANGIYEVMLVDAGAVVPGRAVDGGLPCASRTVDVRVNATWPGSAPLELSSLEICVGSLPIGVDLLLMHGPQVGSRFFHLDAGIACRGFSLSNQDAKSLRESTQCHADLDEKLGRGPFVCNDTGPRCGCSSSTAVLLPAAVVSAVGVVTRRRRERAA